MDMYDLVRNAELLKTKDTEALLRSVQGDTSIKGLFKLMLDSSITYNITAIPDAHNHNYCIGGSTIYTDAALHSYITILQALNLRGDKLKEGVQKIYDMSDQHRRGVLKWILDKGNPARISAKMCNKVWPGLMYEQLYMGAVPNTDGALEALPWESGVMVQVKENGMTLIGFCDGGNTTLHTRNGTDLTEYFPSTSSLVQAVYSSLGIKTGVLMHFEAFLVKGVEDGLFSREEGNAKITAQVTNGTVGGYIDKNIVLVLLDYYAWDDYTTSERYERMCKVQKSSWARIVESRIMFSPEDAKAWARDLILKGGEGVICKHSGKPWTNGKPLFNVKIKHEFECDLVVVGIKPHSKNPYLVGSLVCESRDKKLAVSVGSGLTDALRDTLFESWIGRIVTVKAEYITESKGKKVPSLNNPRFIEQRFDLDEANSLEEIQAQYTASKGVVS